MLFMDRSQAGKALAGALDGFIGQDSVVYALPRGGVVLGYEVARHLDAPLDLIITRKIGYPGSRECAVCAISEDGEMICDSLGASRLDPVWLGVRAEEEMEEANRRRRAYLEGRPPLMAGGKVAIVVDDGMATGLTVLLAIMVLKKQHPKSIVVAVPVSSMEAAEKIRREADELVALDVPPDFGSVSEHYAEFAQLEDEDVIRLLRAAEKRE